MANKLLTCEGLTTGDGAINSNAKGEPPPTVLICASMIPELPLGHEAEVNAVAKVGAPAAAIVDVPVPIFPQASFTATV